MNEDAPRYAAYMLRLWQVGSSNQRAWCASLESPHTGERHVFTDLQALFSFLQESTQYHPQPAVQPKE